MPVGVTPDVVVSGAGPAGALAALCLARAGARVVLLDRATFPRHKLCGDTVNPGGLALLREAGLADVLDVEGLPLDGMLVTGPTGVSIRGVYGPGITGRAWSRRALDAMLVAEAARAGADVRDGVRVLEPLVDAGGRVSGVTTASPRGREHVRARWTIAADGRRSVLGVTLGLTAQPIAPRRWAVGTYAEGVTGLGRFGEMHVRAGYYVGVAPAADGLANVCLVTSCRHQLGDPAAALWHALRSDRWLRDRCERARGAVGTPAVLGPLAVDARACGAPGLLLAGDAAGFVDPMTGDGLHLAMRGGWLAAQACLRAAAHPDQDVLSWLARARTRAFGRKLRFNRALRHLVGSPMGVRLGSLGAAVAPVLLRQVIATAGDVPGHTWRVA